jgi:hypothetical protein
MAWRCGTAKVLSALWADDERFEVKIFIRGPWEDLALALDVTDLSTLDFTGPS